MYPTYDVVCCLIETPFTHWSDRDKKEVLGNGRPKEPLLISDTRAYKKLGKVYNIKFNASWFAEFPWLCSSPILKKLFCWPCLLFANTNTVWSAQGFADFSNIRRSLFKHEDSSEHLKCRLHLKNFDRRDSNVANPICAEKSRLLNLQFNEKVRLNRICFHRVIDSVLFSAESTPRDKNFEDILTLVTEQSCAEIRKHFADRKILFRDNLEVTRQEVGDCILEYMQELVLAEVAKTIFFAIQVDEAIDVGHASGYSIIMRYVNSDATLVERFLGFHDLKSFETLFDLLDPLLTKFAYERKLVAQGYDGASVMSKHLDQLQRRIKNKAPQAVLVHCLTHHINFVLRQCLNTNPKCRLFFTTVSEMSSFFQLPLVSSIVAKRVPSADCSRWSSVPKLFARMVQDWNTLKNVFEVTANAEETDTKIILLSRGFLNELHNFEFTFLTLTFGDIFSLTNLLFDGLQKKSLDIGYCLAGVTSACDILNSKRNAVYFKTVFDATKMMTPVRNQRKGCAALSRRKLFENYKALYFEILYVIITEINIRFQDYEKLKFRSLADTTKFQKFDAEFPFSAFESLYQWYPQFFTKRQRLQNELCLLYADQTYRNVPPETVLRLLHDNRNIFGEAYKLFALVLTIPSTSASVASCLKKIRSYTKRTVSPLIPSSLANISIEKQLLGDVIKNQLFYEDVVDKFAYMKDRNIDFIHRK